jgi:hypothetical protein
MSILSAFLDPEVSSNVGQKLGDGVDSATPIIPPLVQFELSRHVFLRPQSIIPSLTALASQILKYSTSSSSSSSSLADSIASPSSSLSAGLSFVSSLCSEFSSHPQFRRVVPRLLGLVASRFLMIPSDALHWSEFEFPSDVLGQSGLSTVSKHSAGGFLPPLVGLLSLCPSLAPIVKHFMQPLLTVLTRTFHPSFIVKVDIYILVKM